MCRQGYLSRSESDEGVGIFQSLAKNHYGLEHETFQFNMSKLRGFIPNVLKLSAKFIILPSGSSHRELRAPALAATRPYVHCNKRSRAAHTNQGNCGIRIAINPRRL